jgi:hypothetical protein
VAPFLDDLADGSSHAQLLGPDLETGQVLGDETALVKDAVNFNCCHRASLATSLYVESV